jgi:hypothetical protein
MDFHYSKLVKPAYRPRPFSHAVRREDHDPEGVLSLEAERPGSMPDPVTTTVAHREAVRPMSFALDASTRVSFLGDRFLHGFVSHQFSGSAGLALSLVARARQFSSFILLAGRIAGADTFEPKLGIIVQNKDLVKIPLMLELIPTPKAFRDAIESLSPEQQRFARAFRAMQLESTLFGVCVIQIKPQLEALLRLDPDSLTKEIKLTQELLGLFIEYQIPSDLLSYDGPVDAPSGEKIARVKEYVARMQEMIELSKKREIDEAREREALRRAQATPLVRNRLGELLVREKLISLLQLRQAQEEQRRSGTNLGYALARLGFLSEREITNFLAAQYRVPAIDLDEYELDPDITKLVPKELCEKYKIIPLARSGHALIVAMADPSNLHAIDDVKFLTGFNVEPVVASETALTAAIERAYSAQVPTYDEMLMEFGDDDAVMHQDIEYEGTEALPASAAEPAEPAEPAPPATPEEVTSARPDARAEQAPRSASDGGNAVDYTRIPGELDKKFEQLDGDAALRPTIIHPGEVWSRTSQKGLLDAPSSVDLVAEEQSEEKNKAFDLLDALSKSGALPIAHASLHVVIAATHAFDETLLDTVIQGNVNPIEKVERSLMIVATTIHGRPASELLAEDQRDRFFTFSPRLGPGESA